MNLVIVESPSKAKTISKYLDNTYEVRASVGHIRDLPKSNKKAIDIPGGFIPHYEISKGKEKIVSELKAISKKAKEIILATDPDREGEAIAWHIKEACNLKNPKRVVFYEITESAVKEAMKNPRNINEHLRKSQEARRVLDRLFGYGLSGLIWKKLRYGLSAGRVQSPALRIIMEREREIRIFVPQKYWVISGTFKYKNGEELVLICDEEPKTEDEMNRIVEIAQKNKNWKIVSIKQTEIKRSPRPPFITSTLEQTASSRFGFSPSKTMVLAQKLYEAGHISYMRTDSITISKEALKQVYAEIEKVFGKEYLSPRTYVTKRKSAQEAHEAIRPTKILKREAGASDEQKRLYKLIWQRTIASQMTDAKTLRTKLSANIEEENTIPNFSVNGSVILFPGWFSVDRDARGENKEIPDLNKGDIISLLNIGSEQKETLPLPRYTEAGLIKELEKREIGRPSTYATIIRTIQEREYVTKEGRTLIPTDTGEVVSNFLEKHFAKYISDSFTAEMENDLDEIAEGKKEYEKILSNFYKPFLKELKSKEHIEKITNLGEADKKFKCPVCKSSMVIKLGRTGKFLSCKKFPKCTGALKIDGMEIEAPKETGEICPKCDGKLFEREGRYGKFIACGNYPKCKYVKKSKEEEEKAKTGVKCPKCSSGEITERRGRFGLFYSCSDYPNCKFIIKSRPTGNLCPLCNSLMMEGTKTIPERCSDKACPNHNPHKLALNKH